MKIFKFIEFTKDVFTSLDMIAAIIVGIFSCYLLPPNDIIPGPMLKDIYSIAINVLAILFSMFFAALTIIVSINDSDFVSFLEEDYLLSDILRCFKFSLGITFIVLFITILLYIWTVFNSSNKYWGQYSGQFSLFLWAFSYSTFAMLLTAKDAIRLFYSRVKYVRIMREHNHNNH